MLLYLFLTILRSSRACVHVCVCVFVHTYESGRNTTHACLCVFIIRMLVEKRAPLGESWLRAWYTHVSVCVRACVMCLQYNDRNNVPRLIMIIIK